MVSNEDFNFFLKHGYIPGLEPGTHMSRLIEAFGPDEWYVKNFNSNGLIHGIIKIGITEFHVFDEKVSGISYRPDIWYPKDDYKRARKKGQKKVSKPWILRIGQPSLIEARLKEEGVAYQRHKLEVKEGSHQTAGGNVLFFEDSEFEYIDTEGGVTFLFDELEEGKQRVRQVCKYYNEDW